MKEQETNTNSVGVVTSTFSPASDATNQILKSQTIWDQNQCIVPSRDYCMSRQRSVWCSDRVGSSGRHPAICLGIRRSKTKALSPYLRGTKAEVTCCLRDGAFCVGTVALQWMEPSADALPSLAVSAAVELPAWPRARHCQDRNVGRCCPWPPGSAPARH